jgi:hypothetical protein
MLEEKDDLKKGEDSPEGTDQPEEETAESEEEGEEETQETSDDEVKISKSELEKLRKDANEKENYRKAVIRLNKLKGRSLPGSEPEKKPEQPVDDFDEPKEEYVTKKELLERDNKNAINKACENPEIDENWDEIIAFYIPPRDNSYESKLSAILKAHKLCSLDSKAETPEPKDTGKKATADLAAEKGLSKGKEKKPEAPKKSILPKTKKMEQWY